MQQVFSLLHACAGHDFQGVIPGTYLLHCCLIFDRHSWCIVRVFYNCGGAHPFFSMCTFFSRAAHVAAQVAMYLGLTHRNRSAIPLLRTYLHAVSSASCIVRVFYTMCTFFSTSARNIPAAHDRSSRITKIGVFFLPHAATVKSDSTFRLTTKLVWGCEQPRV